MKLSSFLISICPLGLKEMSSEKEKSEDEQICHRQSEDVFF